MKLPQKHTHGSGTKPSNSKSVTSQTWESSHSSVKIACISFNTKDLKQRNILTTLSSFILNPRVKLNLWVVE